MIIKRLFVKNFGVYSGEHSIDLTPTSASTPIILIGGYNGGGKTTLLDAVHLTLFGKLSRCSSRGNLAYEEFLRRSISRSAAADAEAYVGMEIRQTFDGTTHDFVVRRAWTCTGKGATEMLQVFRDGAEQKDLAASWLEHVDQFVPLGLAELFFFDGEKIARLAESESAAQMLGTAINTLLGIDLVDRLEKDLLVYERDLTKSHALPDSSIEVQKKEREFEENRKLLERLIQERGTRQNDLDQAKKKLEAEEQVFRRQGGDLFTQRKQFELELASAAGNAKRVEDELRELAEGAAPLLVAERPIERVREQATLEEEAERQALMLSELERRDTAMLAKLKKEELDHSARATLDALFTEDRRKRERAAKAERFLNIDRTAYPKIQSLTSHALGEIRNRAVKLLEEHHRLAKAVLRLEDRLTQVPDEAAIADIGDRVRAAEKSLHKKEAEFATLQEKIDALYRQNDENERGLINVLERALTDRADHDEVARKLQYAAKVRTTMREFRTRVLERKIKQIEGLVLESFQMLLRKKNLVSSIRIDPATYQMELIGADGRSLATERLSAGERQLLAVSLLWGLAKASGRPLPNIIDTPLGRLDSHHRINLVERYFPYASHQVIILSTDEEIGDKYLPQLRSRIGRSYHLAYSDENKSTVVNKGYLNN